MLGGIFCCCGGKDEGAGPLYLTLDHQRCAFCRPLNLFSAGVGLDVCLWMRALRRKATTCLVQGGSISGEGSALGSAAVLQDRAFWCVARPPLALPALAALSLRLSLIRPRVLRSVAGRRRW
jgi:hypothetical protein